MLSCGSSSLAGVCKAPQRTAPVAHATKPLPDAALIKKYGAEGILDNYPTPINPKDRSNERIVQLAGASKDTMSYLDGSLPGDYGFDPLNVYIPKPNGFMTPEWLRYAEILNGRWAMLGVAGCFAPDALGSWGLIPPETQVLWWKTGVIPPFGSEFEFWAEPWSLFWIEILLMQFAELKRLQDWRNPGSQSKQWFLGLEGLFEGAGTRYEAGYPGGRFFNFMGLAEGSEEEKKRMRTREINNARLAMVAMLGYFSQAVMTNKGPYTNLVEHVADPWKNCLFGEFADLPY